VEDEAAVKDDAVVEEHVAGHFELQEFGDEQDEVPLPIMEGTYDWDEDEDADEDEDQGEYEDVVELPFISFGGDEDDEDAATDAGVSLQDPGAADADTWQDGQARDQAAAQDGIAEPLEAFVEPDGSPVDAGAEPDPEPDAESQYVDLGSMVFGDEPT